VAFCQRSDATAFCDEMQAATGNRPLFFPCDITDTQALGDVLAQAAQATMAACPNYRWLGGRPHEETRRRIQRAHLLIHTSRMEGGAHVIIEAAVSGTPVLASRIDGNIGMLGEEYAGYFDWNDAAGLAALLSQCRDAQNDLLSRLAHQTVARAGLFTPASECAKVRELALLLSDRMVST
jgi:glycosyltransferase involved in cell wall biosynthesis